MSSSTAQQPEQTNLPAMGFLQHLEELRKRIIRSVIFIVAGFGICWNYHDRIWNWIQTPIIKALAATNFDTTLVYTNPTEPFNIFLKVALIGGIFVSSPFVLYQVWAFIAPGLYPNALKFLIEFSKSAQLKPMITIGEYLDLFMTIILGLGIVFEMPILVFFLSLFGIVSAGWMWRNLRYSILVIFVIAAIITPTTDIMNMCIFAAP